MSATAARCAARVQAVVGSGVRRRIRRQLEFALLAPRVAVRSRAQLALPHAAARANWTVSSSGDNATARPTAAAVVAVVIAITITTTIHIIVLLRALVLDLHSRLDRAALIVVQLRLVEHLACGGGRRW